MRGDLRDIFCRAIQKDGKVAFALTRQKSITGSYRQDEK